MGAKQSSHNGRANARNVGNGAAVTATGLPEGSRVVALDPRIRTRSLNNVGQSLSIPGHSASFQESDLSSSPEDNSPSPRGLAMQGAHSLPSHLFATYTTFLNGKRVTYIYFLFAIGPFLGKDANRLILCERSYCLLWVVSLIPSVLVRFERDRVLWLNFLCRGEMSRLFEGSFGRRYWTSFGNLPHETTYLV